MSRAARAPSCASAVAKTQRLRSEGCGDNRIFGPREDGMFGVLGLLCIIIGFVVAIIEEKILFGPLSWFIAAIAFNTIGTVPFLGKGRAR
jgi:type IV secretory pathway TrbD component